MNPRKLEILILVVLLTLLVSGCASMAIILMTERF